MGKDARHRDVEVREPADPRDLLRLIDRVLREELDVAPGDRLPEDVEGLLDRHDPADIVLSAVIDGRNVGALVAVHDPEVEGVFTVSWLAVDRAARARGIGRELLGQALAAMTDRSAVLVKARTLAVWPSGPRLYWSHGFRVVDVIPAVVAGRPREVLLFEKRLVLPEGAATC